MPKQREPMEKNPALLDAILAVSLKQRPFAALKMEWEKEAAWQEVTKQGDRKLRV